MGNRPERRQRTGSQHGFTLAETLVALALVGLVVLPATVAFHRLLDANKRLQDDIEAELLVRQELERTALDVRRGLVPEDVRVSYPNDGGIRVVTRFQATRSDGPATLAVSSSRGRNDGRSARTALPPETLADTAPAVP